MGHKSKEKIDFSKFKRMEAFVLPGNELEWSCFHNDMWLKVYLSEAIYKNPYTIVGVCDGDDCYVKKQYECHDSAEAFELYQRLINMSLIFRQDLYDLGMECD